MVAARSEGSSADSSSLLLPSDKGLPIGASGLAPREFLATAPRLSEFWTPLLVLEADALSHNVEAMARWCSQRGFELVPHGKTTMAPQLWQMQVDAGATGITLATMGQVRAARDLGFDSLLLANGVTDPRSLEYLAKELDDPVLRFSCWADSVESVQLMEQNLRGLSLSRPIDVCVELGAPGGRTGARSLEEAGAIARRLHDSPVLRLAGVAGYEGALAHERSDHTLGLVREYLSALLDLHLSLMSLYDDQELLLTAGGSAFLDLIAEVLEPATRVFLQTRFMIRSGAYITHDDGFYAEMAAQGAWGDPEATRDFLLPALRGYGRVVSRPEPGLALLDVGKRDLPYDEGMPSPLAISSDLGGVSRPLVGAEIFAMNDQHAYLRFPEGSEVRLGEVVTLGISHPCTAFDKWRYIPVVASGVERHIVSLVRTYF